MTLVENKTKVFVEAAELHVASDNVVNPEKLAMLAEEGWAIYSAWKLKGGGFNLLLTRKRRDNEQVRVIHEGTSRCPNYCNCLSSSQLPNH